jgi:uncharacterized protein DUF6915
MAHPYHHALASVKKWGGEVSDYLPLHDWFDQSKAIAGDYRHRALRHHAEGIFMLETIFGPTITLSTGRIIPTRYVGEQHVQQDLGFIPSFADWMRAIRPLPWMGRAGCLDDRPDHTPAAAQPEARINATPDILANRFAHARGKAFAAAAAPRYHRPYE